MSEGLLAGTPRALTPTGWSWRRLGDLASEVAERANGVEYPVLSVTKHRGIVRAEDYFKKAVHGRETSNYKVVRRGQFAYATIHLDEGSIGCLRDDDAGIVSPMYTVFDLRDGIEREYLLRVLKQPASLATYRTLAQGTVNRRASIGFTSLASLHALIPPLAEQRKIAAILSSVDDAIEASQAVIDQLRVVKKAMMAELLTKGIPGRHKKFKPTEIGLVPEEWALGTMDELASFSGGNGFTPRDWSPRGLPIIRIQNLNGSLDFNYYAGTPEPDWLVEPGELLFAWAGSRGASFGPCLWPGPKGVLNQHIHRIAPRTTVRKHYLFFLLREITEKIEKRAHGFKDTLVHLRKGELTSWPVALPTLAEQDRIVDVLQEIEQRLSVEEEFLACQRSTKSALMSVLLTGEVRVRLDEEAAA
jgi:type I restriction enzyme S subunit